MAGNWILVLGFPSSYPDNIGKVTLLWTSVSSQNKDIGSGNSGGLFLSDIQSLISDPFESHPPAHKLPSSWLLRTEIGMKSVVAICNNLLILFEAKGVSPHSSLMVGPAPSGSFSKEQENVSWVTIRHFQDPHDFSDSTNPIFSCFLGQDLYKILQCYTPPSLAIISSREAPTYDLQSIKGMDKWVDEWKSHEVASSYTFWCLCAPWSSLGSVLSEVEREEGLPGLHSAKEWAKSLVTLPKYQVDQFSSSLWMGLYCIYSLCLTSFPNIILLFPDWSGGNFVHF